MQHSHGKSMDYIKASAHFAGVIMPESMLMEIGNGIGSDQVRQIEGPRVQVLL